MRVRMTGKAITIAVALVAIAVAALAYGLSEARPATDNASIDAEVVHVASEVGGRVIKIAVQENQRVKKGAVLFEIDPEPYRLAAAQAEADLAIAEAQLATRQRVLFAEGSNATAAGNAASSAESNYALASRTANRLRPLADQGYVPRQALDQAEVTEKNASTALHTARTEQASAEQAVDTIAAAEAAVKARQAALGLAKRNLMHTTVRSPHDGLIVGLTVSTGEIVIPGQSLFTLINSEEWYAVANFRETELGSISRGDCATVYAMTNRGWALHGEVEGTGWGVLDQDRVNIPRSVPFVERSLNWVRVAQRFPVRIKLENPPPDNMRLGASASVQIKHGHACP
jgi:multidrug efflux system membrane fusion protein